MINWFSGSRRNFVENVFTDDPLAAIAADSKTGQIYAVSRVNPIFVEEGAKTEGVYNTVPQVSNRAKDIVVIEEDLMKWWKRSPLPLESILEGGGYQVSQSSIGAGARYDDDFTGYSHLDFTLDGLKAERLIRQLKLRKQKRCWCHLITSFMGLLVFLLSVILVSMLVTRGKRMFGSL